jgi:hypothetical protein
LGKKYSDAFLEIDTDFFSLLGAWIGLIKLLNNNFYNVKKTNPEGMREANFSISLMNNEFFRAHLLKIQTINELCFHFIGGKTTSRHARHCTYRVRHRKGLIDMNSLKLSTLVRNLTHSLDAFVLHYVVYEFAKSNKYISVIHDCFQVHYEDLNFLKQCYLQAVQEICDNGMASLADTVPYLKGLKNKNARETYSGLIE